MLRYPVSVSLLYLNKRVKKKCDLFKVTLMSLVCAVVAFLESPCNDLCQCTLEKKMREQTHV